LRDAQLAASNRLTDAQLAKIDDAGTYVRWRPLGKAFLRNTRSIVLIDEIDKADIDFPNDLLLELDERRFLVEETGHLVKAKVAPIVIITRMMRKICRMRFTIHQVEVGAYAKSVGIH
jgi:MoxR-like ATPase